MYPGELSIYEGLGEFVPSANLPGLQYVEHVDDGSAAAEAGLLPGDYILEVELVFSLALYDDSTYYYY